TTSTRVPIVAFRRRRTASARPSLRASLARLGRLMRMRTLAGVMMLRRTVFIASDFSPSRAEPVRVAWQRAWQTIVAATEPLAPVWRDEAVIDAVGSGATLACGLTTGVGTGVGTGSGAAAVAVVVHTKPMLVVAPW